ncbi:T9SS type A sorting domain-containing protein [Hymenobacter fastidiosus]
MKPFSSLLPGGLLALLLLTFSRPAAAQAPAWQSARIVAVATAAAVNSSSSVSATAVDAAGNVYVAGIFQGTVVLGGTTLTSLGLNDVFVAKFNPASNQFVWAQRAGGTNDDRATALAVSGTSVYVAGYFSSLTVGFGTTTLTNANSNGGSEVYVAKLTDAGSTGSFVWAQRAGGTETDFATALVVSGTSVYVAGFFDSPTAGFGPATLTSAGSYDVFVAKLTDAGSTASFGWAQRAGGTGNDGTFALAVSGTSVYVAGYFQSLTVGFGATTLTNTNANGSNDVYVAKLTDAGSTGSFGWAQRAGGTGDETALALAVSGPSVYVAGSFTSATAGFGPATLTNAGGQDIFVAKLADAGPTGSITWAQRAGGTANDLADALAVSGTSVYVAGHFSNVAGFGATTLTSAGGRAGIRDVFVAKLADAGSTGSFGWAQRAGGTSDDRATALAVSGTSVYVAGFFDSPTVSFSSITLSNPTLNASTSGFLASLTDPTLTATTATRAPAPAQLFPNPAHRTATLRLPAGTAPAPLTLTDALGRAVRRYPAPAGAEATLDLGGLPAGLYLLRGAGPARRLAVE